MALPSVLAGMVFNSVLGKMAESGSTDVKFLTRWAFDSYFERLGGTGQSLPPGRTTYYNYSEYQSVVRSAVAASEASNLYGPDPNSRPLPSEIPRVTTIPPGFEQYQYRVLVEIDGPTGSTATAVTLYSEEPYTYAELLERATEIVQNTQSGRDYLTRVGSQGWDATYEIVVLSVGQRR